MLSTTNWIIYNARVFIRNIFEEEVLDCGYFCYKLYLYILSFSIFRNFFILFFNYYLTVYIYQVENYGIISRDLIPERPHRL